MPKEWLFNIIVRTKNEIRWVRSLLHILRGQSLADQAHITFIDSGSTDGTFEFLKAEACCSQVTLLTYNDLYRPGKAINQGVKSVGCEFTIILSAHCLPVNPQLLESYFHFFRSQVDEKVVAAYGRQLPGGMTGFDDARDLLYQFSDEPRVQSSDPFFHNANSCVKTNFLIDNPFDPDVEHVEDRLWCASIQKNGSKVAYLPSAAVWHFHGINQHGLKYRSVRSKRVVELVSGSGSLFGYRERDLLATAPAKFSDMHQREPFIEFCVLCESEITFEHNEVLKRLVAANNGWVSGWSRTVSTCHNQVFDSWHRITVPNDEPVGVLFEFFYTSMVAAGRVPDCIVLLSAKYSNWHEEIVQKSISLVTEDWCDVAVPAWCDSGNYFVVDELSDELSEIQYSYAKASSKRKIYRTCMVQGGAFAPGVRFVEPDSKYELRLIPVEDCGLIMS